MKLIRTLHRSEEGSLPPFSFPLRHALKEWAIAVDALTAGATILLLRKGGIRETGGRFSVEQHQVWLYPTYEHQQPHLLQAPYAERVSPVPTGWHPERVTIQSWAHITHILALEGQAGRSLLPFQVWNDQFISERLRWKPGQPLYALLLRVHRLQQSQSIPFQPSYGGCKSWITLGEEFDPQVPAAPVLTDEEYGDRVAAILAALPDGEA